MLDPHGFVATCNSTNFFIVRRGEVRGLRFCAGNGAQGAAQAGLASPAACPLGGTAAACSGRRGSQADGARAPRTEPARAVQVWAPTPRYQMPGITRANALGLCRAHGIPCRELDFSLTQVGRAAGGSAGDAALCRRAACQWRPPMRQR